MSVGNVTIDSGTRLPQKCWRRAVESVRRCSATLLLLALALASVEPLLAERCEGDSLHAVAAVSGPADAGTPDTGLPSPPGHSVHTCHHAHAHTGPIGDAQVTLPIVAQNQRVRIADLGAPLAPKIEPLLRPPLTA